MNKTKEAFERPICEALVVRFEGVICLSGGKLGETGWAGDTWTEGNDYNDYGDL